MLGIYQRLTVLSVEVLVDTEPWGHPFPEYVVSTMVISSGLGTSPERGTGFAAASTGRRKAASFGCIFANYQEQMYFLFQVSVRN